MKKIGYIKVLSLVIGNMIGAGSYMMPATLSKYGYYAIIGWLITSVGAIFLAVLFSKMCILDSQKGGPYIYTAKKFGKFSGFQMAVGYWIMCPIGSASLVISIISNLCVFFEPLQSNPLIASIIGIFFVAFFTLINLRGIHNALSIQVVLTALKLIPLFLFCIIAICNFDYSTLCKNQILIPEISPLKAIFTSASISIWTFIGLETATIPNGINTNIITKATITGVIITSILYIGSLVGVMCTLPNDALTSSYSPLSDCTKILYGNFAGSLMNIASLLCFIGSLNGWILIQGQVASTAAKQGIFPTIFAKLNKHRAPYVSILAGSLIICLMVIWQQSNTLQEQFEQTILLASFSTLVPYVYFAAAAFITFHTAAKPSTLWRYIALISFMFSVLFLIGEGQQTIYIGSISFLLLTPLFIFIKNNKYTL